MGLVEIFGDHAGAGNRRVALGDQHRRGAGRIERQKRVAPLPGALFHQPQIEAVFAERQADEARLRTERVVKQRVHGGLDSFARLNKCPDAGAVAQPRRRQTSEARRRGNAVFAHILPLRHADRIGEKNPAFLRADVHPARTILMLADIIRAVILGIVEGVTEFLPVSSTGHLLLAERFFDLGEGTFWKSFAVLIQLGAILAIVALYFAKLWRIALGMFSDPDGAALRDRRAGGVPARGGDRRGGRRLHQGVSVQSVGGVLLADRRRRDPAVGRSARSQAARTTTPPPFRCRCISESASRSAWR